MDGVTYSYAWLLKPKGCSYHHMHNAIKPTRCFDLEYCWRFEARALGGTAFIMRDSIGCTGEVIVVKSDQL